MTLCMCVLFFFFYGHGAHRDLPVLPHSFPNRRSSDLALGLVPPRRRASGCAAETADRHRRLGRHPPAEAAGGCDQPGRGQPHLQAAQCRHRGRRSEEHTSELQLLMRSSYAVFCLTKKTYTQTKDYTISLIFLII